MRSLNGPPCDFGLQGSFHSCPTSQKAEQPKQMSVESSLPQLQFQSHFFLVQRAHQNGYFGRTRLFVHCSGSQDLFEPSDALTPPFGRRRVSSSLLELSLSSLRLICKNSACFLASCAFLSASSFFFFSRLGSRKKWKGIISSLYLRRWAKAISKCACVLMKMAPGFPTRRCSADPRK